MSTPPEFAGSAREHRFRTSGDSGPIGKLAGSDFKELGYLVS